MKPRVEQEDFWLDVADVLQWSTAHAFSSLFLCWGAKAALKYFHDIDSLKSERKLFGLFEHRLVSDKTGLMFGFPDLFPVPVSRWKSPKREDIVKVPALEIVANSEEAGPNMLVESEPVDDAGALFPRRVYILEPSRIRNGDLGGGISPRQRRRAGLSAAAPLFSGKRSLAPRAQPLAAHRAYLHQLGQGSLRGDPLQHRRHPQSDPVGRRDGLQLAVSSRSPWRGPHCDAMTPLTLPRARRCGRRHVVGEAEPICTRRSRISAARDERPCRAQGPRLS